MLSFGPNVRLSLQEQKAELQDKIQLLGRFGFGGFSAVSMFGTAYFAASLH